MKNTNHDVTHSILNWECEGGATLARDEVTPQQIENIEKMPRIVALKQKHHALEAALSEEIKRPLPDPAAMKKMKIQKLRLKDEMEFYKSGFYAAKAGSLQDLGSSSPSRNAA